MGLLGWALVFLVVAIIAGAMGWTSVARTSSVIAKILFVIFAILFLIFFIVALAV